jgi:hypothetical protein
MGSLKKKGRRVTHHALAGVPLATGPAGLGKPTLTVGQIVKQLWPFAPDAAAMSERIRHWTREGLLLPIDQHHPGTGRHRRYSSDATYEAAILNALATAGLQLVSRPYIQTALNQARSALQKWRQAGTAGRKLPLLFLVISHDVAQIGGEPTTSIHEDMVKQNPTAEIAIVLNLSQLFSRMESTLSENPNAGSEQHR